MYLDNAATTFPKPDAVYQATDRFFRELAANPGRGGHRLAVGAESVVARARLRLARLLNAGEPSRIVWTANATESINLGLKGYVRPGDRVVTTCLEHNAVARPLSALEKRGVSVRRVEGTRGGFDLVRFLDALEPGLRLAIVTHASNVTGEVLPLAEIAHACRERGIPLMVDAAQTAGVLPLDVAALDLAMVAMPGHKGLFGPPGTGALYVAPSIRLQPLREGGTGSRSEEDRQPESMPDGLESGTLNTLGLAGLDAALAWLEETGREAVHCRELHLTERLWSGLAGVPGVRLFGPPPGTERAAVISLTLEGWNPTDAALVLDESFDIQCRAGMHCAPWAHRTLGTFPTGTIRLSPGYFNREDEMDTAVAAVASLAGASSGAG